MVDKSGGLAGGDRNKGARQYPRLVVGGVQQKAPEPSSHSWFGGEARQPLEEALSEAIFGARALNDTTTSMKAGAKRDQMATEREVTDAKLEAVEARVETRLVSIEGKLDRLADQLTMGIQRSVEASERAEAAARVAETRADEARKAAGTTKWNILATGLTVIAVVLAVWAVWHQGIDMVAGLLAERPSN